AVATMALLHDTGGRVGCSGRDLERVLVRVLFWLVAGDTSIFEPESFKLYIENRTRADGSDLGARLAELFETLNTAEDRRQRNLDETLKAFPYVNGALFAERLQFAAFDGPMRKAIIEAANFDWARISPAIFGALFQEVIEDNDPEVDVRRKLGAHYTSERDILKVIKPLFLDDLRTEFEAIRADRSTRREARLADFRARLTRLKFLDPACGCGNFLVIAYRELRALELEVLLEQHGRQQALSLDEVSRLSQVDVHQFYGIEIEEWPVRIAEVALWLTDHQANLRILDAFSQPFLRLPLRNSPHIHHGNALRMDWNDVLPATQCSYILGNPPFIGKAFMSKPQKADMGVVYQSIGGVAGGGVLDYVAAWYFKAAAYTATGGGTTPICFVSTNSITQGEQPAILWAVLRDRFGLMIQFAYRTFSWESEAKGKAHVHVIIMGLTRRTGVTRTLFEENEEGVQSHSTHDAITPYLLPGTTGALKKRTRPISAAPNVIWGSMPNDGSRQ